MTLMSYDELLSRTDAPAGSSWGLFGDRGTLSRVTPDIVRDAMSLVRRGARFSLDLPLDALALPPSSHRNTIEHTVFGNGVCHRDDHVHLYCQASSHFDSLRHIRHHHHGYYNGAPDASVDAGERLGIDQWVDEGIVGRAVLIDVARHLERTGAPPLDHRSGQPFGVDLLEEALAAQGVERRVGDIVLLRTGWLDDYLRLSHDEQVAVRSALKSPGLVQSHDTLRWLWDTGVAAILADNAAVECYPPIAGSPLDADLPADGGIPAGMMHPSMIALLGLIVGELWWLEELADDCAEDGVYEALFVAKPLNLPGGVGSPANALAFK